MRGVENGFAVLRAAEHGLLTASDAQGRILASKGTIGAGMATIVSNVPLGPGSTLYTRIGDLFAWVSVALALFLGALVAASRSR